MQIKLDPIWSRCPGATAAIEEGGPQCCDLALRQTLVALTLMAPALPTSGY